MVGKLLDVLRLHWAVVDWLIDWLIGVKQSVSLCIWFKDTHMEWSAGDLLFTSPSICVYVYGKTCMHCIYAHICLSIHQCLLYKPLTSKACLSNRYTQMFSRLGWHHNNPWQANGWGGGSVNLNYKIGNSVVLHASVNMGHMNEWIFDGTAMLWWVRTKPIWYLYLHV